MTREPHKAFRDGLAVYRAAPDRLRDKVLQVAPERADLLDRIEALRTDEIERNLHRKPHDEGLDTEFWQDVSGQLDLDDPLKAANDKILADSPHHMTGSSPPPLQYSLRDDTAVPLRDPKSFPIVRDDGDGEEG